MYVMLNGAWDLLTRDMEKDKVLNAFFYSIFFWWICPLEFQALEMKETVWSKQDLPSVEDRVREHQTNCTGMNPWTLDLWDARRSWLILFS